MATSSNVPIPFILGSGLYTGCETKIVVGEVISHAAYKEDRNKTNIICWDQEQQNHYQELHQHLREVS